MTSSLVGSEMCIRDRVYAVLPWCLAWQPTCLLLEVAEEGKGHQLLTPSPCLLYTSDAADDM
eukprot:4332508-Prorocentrum_lima.AAC.1